MKTILKTLLWKSVSRTRLVSDIYYHRNQYRLDLWLETKYQFVHIPKCAGTSIAKALGLPDPGHFTYEQLKGKGITSDNALNFSVVRNPQDRLVSTFKYAKKAHSKNGENPLSWIARYSNIDDFVLEGLSERDVRNNYFLLPSQRFVEGCPEESMTIIDFDTLEEGFNEVVRLIGISDSGLPKENVSESKSIKMSPQSKEKIIKLYADDYELSKKIGANWE